MSLINDALRRAKDTQQQTPAPPSPNLPFRPVEPAPPSAGRGQGLLLPVALVVVALLSVLSAWQWFQHRNSTGPTEVNARTPRVAPPVPHPPTGFGPGGALGDPTRCDCATRFSFLACHRGSRHPRGG